MTRYKLIKAIEVKGPTSVIDKSRNSILIAVVMAMAVWIITLVIMVMTMAMRIITLMVMMVLMFIVMMVLVLFFYVAFNALNPSGRCGYLFKIEEFGIQNLRERHIAIIAVNNFGFWLNSSKNSPDMFAFLSTYL